MIHPPGPRATNPDDAWSLLCGLLRPREPETILFSEASGRTPAEEILCPRDFPQENIALRDGFALRAEDLSSTSPIRIVGASRAGQPWVGSLEAGTAVSVTTGGVLPLGTDVVLPMEEVRAVSGDVFSPPKGLRAQSHVGSKGHVFRKGQVVLPCGELIGEEGVGVLAALGIEALRVFPKPRVRILPTGSELVSVGEAVTPGRTYVSHGWYLKARVEEDGGCASVEPPVSDDVRDLRNAFSRGGSADLVVTTGGTGQSERDLLGRALREVGARIVFHGVRMRPGRTVSLYQVEGRPLLALPGGMGGVKLGYQILVGPAVRVLLGEKLRWPEWIECLTEGELIRDPKDWRFLEARVRAEGGQLLAAVLSRRCPGWGVLTTRPDGWLAVAPGSGAVPPGSLVPAVMRRRQIRCEEREGPLSPFRHPGIRGQGNGSV